MKIRTSFVANSSSSSFIVSIDRDKVSNCSDIEKNLLKQKIYEVDKKDNTKIIREKISEYLYNQINKNSEEDVYPDYEEYAQFYLQNHTIEEYKQNHIWFKIDDFDSYIHPDITCFLNNPECYLKPPFLFEDCH